MKLIHVLIVSLPCLSVFAANEPETKAPLPPTQLEYIEPDWSPIGDGNYSPWMPDEDGDPVWNPTKAYNTWIDSIPDEDKAWPILVDLRYKYDALFSNRFLWVFAEDVGEDWDEDGVDDWQQISELYASTDIKPIVERLLEALSKPHMGYTLHIGTDPVSQEVLLRYGLDDEIENKEGANPNVFSCLKEDHGIMRRKSQFMASYLSYQVEQGNTEQFADRFAIGYRSSLLVEDWPSILSTLTAMGNQSRFLDLLRWTLYTHSDQLTDDQLVTLDRVIENSTAHQVQTISDQLEFHDIARRIYNFPEMKNWSDTDWDGPPISIHYDELPKAVRTVITLYDIVMHDAHKSSLLHQNDDTEPKWYVEMDDFETLDYPIESIGRMLLGMMMPAVDKATSRTRRHRANAQAMRLAIAAHRHKLRHGSFPKSIEHFNQDLIGFEFIDPFVGGDLLYRLDPETGPMIYAKGYDNDDDQGRHGLDIFLETKKIDGDFLYYPNPWTTQNFPEDEDDECCD